MKRSILLTFVALSVFFALISVGNVSAQTAIFHESGAVLCSPPFGLFDVSGSGGQVIVTQPGGPSTATIDSMVGGLLPNKVYSVFVMNYNTLGASSWESGDKCTTFGAFTQLGSIFTDNNGDGQFQFTHPVGNYNLSVWIDDPNTALGNRTVLVSDSFNLTPSVQVSIDIKPGSDLNCFNNNGHGAIPVAILGSSDFDVNDIDAGTVVLDGMAVKFVGKSNKLLAHIEDSNGDGFDDLVIQIENMDGVFEVGDTTATLTGDLLNGTPFEGTDSICITQ